MWGISNTLCLACSLNYGLIRGMRKQLLWLMFLLSKNDNYLQAVRNTRRANKINFKVPSKVLHMYEHSPYYIGTKLWETLPETVQRSDNVFLFKVEIIKLYTAYKKIL